MTTPRHFIDLADLQTADLRAILTRSQTAKRNRRNRFSRPPERTMAGRSLAMIFEKASTRTRVSFDLAMRELGGETLVLSAADMQLGRGETIADTARVLSRYVDAIMVRANRHSDLVELAHNASVPVINGLTDRSHPCQLMADILTFEEHKGSIEGKTVAWSGDGNNVAASWIHAAAKFGFELRLACPEPLSPDAQVLDWAKDAGAAVSVTTDPYEAVDGADCVVADTWFSMGDDEDENRHNMLTGFQVDARLMAAAKSDAIFMHCLPAHRGEEVTAEVIDGPQSVVFDEAENRLHAQKGVLAWCLGERAGTELS